jgi:hypothetical protein
VAGRFEHTDEPTRSVESMQFIEYLSDCLLLKYSATWRQY